MKIWTVLFSLALLALSACCQRGDRNSTATVGLATANNVVNPNCLNTGSFNNNLYNNGTCGVTNYNNNMYQSYPVDQQYGFYQGYSTGFRYGFSACPYGTIPSYSSYYGLSCIVITYIQSYYDVAYWQWSPASFSFSFSGYSQPVAYDSQRIVQSCRSNSDCGSGSTCEILGGGQGQMGVCRGSNGSGFQKGTSTALHSATSSNANSNSGGCGF